MGADPTWALEDGEKRDTRSFLLSLSDVLRPLGDPLAVQQAAAELTASYLATSRALYISVRRDEDDYVHIVERDYFNRPDLKSLVGEFPHSAYGAYLNEGLPRGKVMVVDDVHAAPGLPKGTLENFIAIECRSWILVPLIKDGEYIAGFCVVHDRPRQWTRPEVELVSEVAERTWAAVERARAEAAMRMSQQLLAAVFDALPMGIVVTNTEGKVVLANTGSTRYLPTGKIPSCDPERVTRWKSWDSEGQLVEPKNYPGARALRGERVVPGIDMLYTQDDGREIWTRVAGVPLPDAHGRVTRQVNVITDIDAAKRIAEALAASERRFQQFAQASLCALWMRNAENMQLEYASPACLTVFGLEPNDMLGEVHRWAELVLPEDRDMALANMERVRRGAPQSFVYRIRRANDGKFRWIHSTTFPLYDENGKVHHIAGISEDVTETELAHEHHRVLLAELQHRVRNILAIVRGITLRTGQAAGEGNPVAANIANRLDALARVQVLLTHEPGIKADIETMVRDEISAQAPDFTQLELRGPGVALSPKAAESLMLAVHELATNALKHGALRGDAPGSVSVRWSTVERGDVPWLIFDWLEMLPPTATPNPPVAPAAPEGRRRRGFGSELIEQRIPYELGGKGRLEFEPGAVSCHLEFPLGPHMSVLESSIPQLTSVFGGSVDVSGSEKLTGKTILVIEDEFYIARDMATALSSAGARVAGPYANEESAWAELLSRRPDAAVLDINLGHGPSFKLAEYMRNRDIPFVFVTGYNRSEQPEGFADAAWLRKPVNYRQLIGSLSRLFK